MVDVKGKIKTQTKSLRGEEVHIILSTPEKWNSGMHFAKLLFPRKQKQGRRYVARVKGGRSKDKCCKTALLKEVVS